MEESKKNKKRKRLDVKMEIFHQHPDKIPPLVGYFPSGFNPKRSEEEDSTKVRVYSNKNRPNRLQLVVSPNSSKVEFVGTSYSSEAAAAQVCTYALGVLDKETQTLKIVPIASNKIFRLEPRVRGSEVSDKEPRGELQEEDLTAEQKADKIRDLTNLYGTKKSISRAKKMESLKQKEDPISQDAVDKKIEGFVINKDALETAAVYTARNVPPHDPTATTPDKAYPLNKIIFKGEWDYLLDVLELLQSGATISSDAYPSFVCNRIYKLEEIQDEMEKKRLACILSYITHLIKFKDQRSVDGASSAKYHKFPPIILQKFLTLFANSETYRLADDKQDLLISYVLVLTLFIDKFSTDMSDIAKDLRMTPVSLRLHYQNLGCKLSRVDKLLMVTLPVPLQFPKPRTQRRRR
ncbi:PREDICTED: DNA-directed RNA polymerase I subunit rpa49 [Nelumbo nucifera]|uniref:DNA-directed RNA polymerase I subunit rpa49 n=1 Tax=Nelumbo nucifera TaxID=4432 RepID=A0A1U8BC37_NELNU|nr:PREDICTED: DNA-directed RNA polymerase I subunit rpa49 [Nelumbo nucifera]